MVKLGATLGRGVLVLGLIATWGLTACSSPTANADVEGRFGTDELQEAIEAAVAENGLVAMPGDAQPPAGTLEDTYSAARVLEDRTPRLITDASIRSMAEAVARADGRSAEEGTAARLMRARILHEAGQLKPAEREDVLRRYSELVSRGCSASQVRACVIAADAVHPLSEDTLPSLTIPVPRDLPEGSEGAELMYRVLSRGEAIENGDDWVSAARGRGLEPLDDAGDTSRPVNLRLWAAAARSALHHELGTQEEKRVQEGLTGLTSCNGVDRLAVSRPGVRECDLDSTLAYYLSGVWGRE